MSTQEPTSGTTAHGPDASDETTGAEDTEERVRRALRDAALNMKPSPWPASAVREAGDRVRRRRRLAVSVPLTAAVAVAVVVTGVRMEASELPADRTLPAASVPPFPSRSPAPSASTRVSPPPTPVVAKSGERVEIGHGRWMTLTADQVCLGQTQTQGQGQGQGGTPLCKFTANGNQATGTVSDQTDGDASRTLYRPLYIGPGTPAHITVEWAGKEHAAQIVTLPGHPGYATAYLWGPPASTATADRVKITVYDAQGHVLASLAPPGS
ncbi:hypothetical protein [Streptomyces beihaiensis]|uniref:Serine/threonine protein kinase n=1 Tax=Streptomyces beihaiensis TaxID=2984495 RepID=A0ABT3TWV4_9ACTN|nr:hypothetical protein [Streptomyces beihaiensis]MCX3061536.1 hypothetical protein [Streptomyces beihaiensis]